MTMLREIPDTLAVEAKLDRRTLHASMHEQARSIIWLWIAASVLTVVVAVMIGWSLAHPFGVHWDESQYINEAMIDAQRLSHSMILKLGGRILLKSWGRPPAYRLLALPFVAILPLSPVTLRLVSLACFVLSAWLIYRAVSMVADRGAACLALLIFVLSPEIIAASSFFGTDAPLYLATAATLYCICLRWTEKQERNWTWIFLGLALALGFLAKASFLVIAMPALSFVVVADWNSRARTLKYELKAICVTAVLAGPWWLLNFKSVVEYSKFARGFVRNSLGSPSIATLLRWINSAWQCLLGHGVTVVVLLVLGCFITKLLKNERAAVASIEWKIVGLCICSGLPIIVTQLSGTNHLLRHVSPAMIPFAIAMGVIAGEVGFTRSLVWTTVTAAMLLTQTILIVYPVIIPNQAQVDLEFVNGAPAWRVLARFDQWDWRSLRSLSDNCGLRTPQIAYLGGGREFNPPAIQYPWIRSAASTGDSVVNIPDVNWLWRYEDGVVDWQKVITSAKSSDIVLTAPSYIGETRLREDLDNQYNAEFSDRVSALSEFRGPIQLTVGRFHGITLDVFLKRNLVCH